MLLLTALAVKLSKNRFDRHPYDDHMYTPAIKCLQMAEID